jgi:hypothetical protein
MFQEEVQLSLTISDDFFDVSSVQGDNADLEQGDQDAYCRIRKFPI